MLAASWGSGIMNPACSARLGNMDSELDAAIKTSEMCSLCRCGCCKDECPMYAEMLEESISPKGRNVLFRALSQGLVCPDSRAVRIAYSCLLCKRDEISCSAGLKNAQATEAFRQYLVDHGIPMLPGHDVLVKSLENYRNPWQESKAARKRWAKEFQDRRVVPGKTKTLFYVGCTYALDRSLQESPRALARAMELFGEDFGMLLEQETCCGSTAKRMGHKRLFEKLREENEKSLREARVKTIVTACSGCFKTLKQDYPELDKEVQILHSTEYLASRIKDHRQELAPVKMKVTYHDPCHLGRYMKIYEAPREILRSIPGLKLVEMSSSRELSRCCGGGGGVKTAYPEISLAIAKTRLKEAEATGADALITACPFCVQSLRAAAEATGSKMEVLSLEVLVWRSLSQGGGQRN